MSIMLSTPGRASDGRISLAMSQETKQLSKRAFEMPVKLREPFTSNCVIIC